MKKKLAKITLRQLHRFCSNNENMNKSFRMNSDTECVLAEFAKQVLHVEPLGAIFCRFTTAAPDAVNRQIKFNGVQNYQFPQSFVDLVFDLAHDATPHLHNGYSLAVTI